MAKVSGSLHTNSSFLQLISHNPQAFISGRLSVPVAHTRSYFPIPLFGQTAPNPLTRAFNIPETSPSTIADWLPEVVPSPDYFGGLDRNVDPIRLAGCRYNGSQGGSIEEVLTTSLALLAREAAKPDLVLLSKVKYAELNRDLDARVQYFTSRHGTSGQVYDGIKFQSAYGIVMVIVDDTIAADRGYVISTYTWNYDKILTCNQPGKNLVILF